MDDCHGSLTRFDLSTNGNSKEELTLSTCVTLLTTEKVPHAAPTLGDIPTPSPPHLAPSNLVVAPPRECNEKTLPLLDPRGRRLTTAEEDEWEMRYTDLLLKEGLGWDNSGKVVLGILASDSGRRKIVDRLARLKRGQAGSNHQWIVAVKHIKGHYLC